MTRKDAFRASLDPSDLFAADAHGMRACQCLIRAVTAGEGGRYAEQKTLIAEAAAQGGETGQYARRQKRGQGSIKSAGFPKRTRKMDGSIGLTKRAMREGQS